MDRLGGRFSLPSPYSFLPTYLQTIVQSIEGCDAILEKCVLSIILPPILRQQACAVAMQKKMSLKQSKMEYV